MIILYSLLLFILTVYSYALIDPNITFFQTKWWEIFRLRMVELGYYRRDLSWIIYLVIIILLFTFNYFFIKKYKHFDVVKLAIYIGIILLFSYPLLSHDFFNYMFDAKIATFYQQNPYLYKALDFPKDPWLRFMHWTHRTYPYGPIFLLITVIPSFLSFGKFVLSFLFFKSTFIVFYILAVFFLNKLNKRCAMIFATNPLIIIEGLVSSHNDLIGVALGIIGIWYLFKNRSNVARIFFFLSLGVKYITFPIVFLTRKNASWNKLIFTFLLRLIIYLAIKSEIQPWYFINLFIFLPFYEQLINRLNIFFFGLLLSYYPYIRLGGWDSLEKINIKHWIIGAFLIINIIYLLSPRKKFSLK